MQPVKMLVLAMATAVVGMAFIGVSSAMAILDFETVICGEDVELCAKGKILPAQSIITLKALEGENAPVILGTINEKCKKSTLELEITSFGGMGWPLNGQGSELGGLSFTECSPCTNVTASTGIGTLSMAGEVGGKKLWELEDEAFIALSGCTFGVKCEYFGITRLSASNDLAAGGLLVLAEKELLLLIGGNSKALCGTHGLWDAHYVASGHWLSSYELP